MPTGKASPATAIQIARYGHVAALLRAEMAKRDWGPAQFNEAMKLGRSNTTIYQWLNCQGAPGPKLAPKVAKLLGVPVANLRANLGGTEVAVSEPRRAVVLAPSLPVGQRRAEVLSFVAMDDGNARIRLDATLPIAQAMPLLRMLLDAGMLIGETVREGGS
jgi:transcriptional regulator with XRE-family HTH domain